MLGEEKNGFRKGRAFVGNVYIVKELIGRRKKYEREFHLSFIDIERVYDSVNRNTLMKLLKHRDK